jgi:hypothetical protein
MTPHATIPGHVYERAVSIDAQIRAVRSIVTGAATETSLIRAINALDRAAPEITRLSSDLRRLLTEVRTAAEVERRDRAGAVMKVEGV